MYNHHHHNNNNNNNNININTGHIGSHYKQVLLYYCTALHSPSIVESSIGAVMHQDHIILAQNSAPPLYVAHRGC